MPSFEDKSVNPTSKKEKPVPTKTRKPKITDKQILEAIENTGDNIMGIVSYAFRVFGIHIHRDTINTRIKKNKKLTEARRQATEKDLDIAESVLRKEMFGDPNKGKPPNMTALIFFLKTKGKSRGWTERQEITGANGTQIAAIPPKFRVTFTNNKPKDTDEHEQ